MGKYRQKPDVGSGDEVTETLLEIMPLVRQDFQEVVNRDNLLEAVDADRERADWQGQLSHGRRKLQ